MIFRVPQSSILVLLEINIILAHFFFKVSDIDIPSYIAYNNPCLVTDS